MSERRFWSNVGKAAGVASVGGLLATCNTLPESATTPPVNNIIDVEASTHQIIRGDSVCEEPEIFVRFKPTVTSVEIQDSKTNATVPVYPTTGEFTSMLSIPTPGNRMEPLTITVNGVDNSGNVIGTDADTITYGCTSNWVAVSTARVRQFIVNSIKGLSQ